VTGGWTVAAVEALAALALGRGRPAEARAIVGAYVRNRTERLGYAVFVLPTYALGLRAEAELAASARERHDAAAEREAVEHAADLLEQTRALTRGAWPLGTPPVEAVLLSELCELEAARARGEDDADAWAARATRCLEHDRPYLAAYARLREADAALAAGLPRARIADALAAAQETGARLRARPFLDEVDRVSRRARVTIASAGGDTDLAAVAAGLTERELDVLRLVAQGQTNPEIGRTLYMSPKTASVHVSRILAKLGARSRAEAVDAAHRLGLIGAAGE
jgi:DNA-binding CsgD family transcriptional regulator